ncbi:unnamed protein product [Closterium sp. Yama58-4]|nr:unnamed protein product [Closterium sp. Yama58-4]
MNLEGLVRIKRLEVKGCSRLQGTPTKLPHLLERLSLPINQQHTSPFSPFSMLSELRGLPLGTAQVTHELALSQSFSCLTRLELNLADNLQEIPFPLASVSHLRALTIWEAAGLKFLREDIGSKLQQLRQLHVHKPAELEELPGSIAMLQRLTSLEIHALKLASLPDGIGSLSRLRTLDLSQCTALVHLPSSLMQLACLNSLHLTGCSIRILPPNFERLTRLRTLDLDNCKDLEALREGITQLKALRWLSVVALRSVGPFFSGPPTTAVTALPHVPACLALPCDVLHYASRPAALALPPAALGQRAAPRGP